MTIKRILVPVDFSPNSLYALDYAVDFAKPWKAALQLVFVVEPLYYAMSEFAAPAVGELLEEQRRHGRADLIRLEQRYAKRGVKIQARMQVGAPYRAIVDVAKQLKADLIIMATHGRTGVSHLLLGSVAERVVRLAHCPVLTVHPAKRARRAAAGVPTRKGAPHVRRRSAPAVRRKA